MNFSVQLMSQIKTEACQHNVCVNSSICPTSRNKPFLKVAVSGIHIASSTHGSSIWLSTQSPPRVPTSPRQLDPSLFQPTAAGHAARPRLHCGAVGPAATRPGAVPRGRPGLGGVLAVGRTYSMCQAPPAFVFTRLSAIRVCVFGQYANRPPQVPSLFPRTSSPLRQSCQSHTCESRQPGG